MCIRWAISKLTLACFMECEWGMSALTHASTLGWLIYLASVSSGDDCLFVCVSVCERAAVWLRLAQQHGHDVQRCQHNVD